jgi:hypothetical protein
VGNGQILNRSKRQGHGSGTGRRCSGENKFLPILKNLKTLATPKVSDNQRASYGQTVRDPLLYSGQSERPNFAAKPETGRYRVAQLNRLKHTVTLEFLVRVLVL